MVHRFEYNSVNSTESILGIENINRPDYGEAVTVKEDELWVFWACGITTQQGLRSAKVPFAITHAPGHMLVLDMFNHELSKIGE